MVSGRLFSCRAVPVGSRGEMWQNIRAVVTVGAVYTGISVGSAVGSNKQLCTVVKGGICRQQLYLTRPLTKP